MCFGPTTTFVVHDDQQFLDDAESALTADGHRVTIFSDRMAALDALGTLGSIDLLITRVRFPKGKPHGVSLAQSHAAGALI